MRIAESDSATTVQTISVCSFPVATFKTTHWPTQGEYSLNAFGCVVDITLKRSLRSTRIIRFGKNLVCSVLDTFFPSNEAPEIGCKSCEIVFSECGFYLIGRLPTIRERRFADPHHFFARMYASCPVSIASCTWSCTRATIFFAFRLKSFPASRT
jgi:hypothetical protein